MRARIGTAYRSSQGPAASGALLLPRARTGRELARRPARRRSPGRDSAGDRRPPLRDCHLRVRDPAGPALPAVTDVDLKVERGEFVAVGANGSNQLRQTLRRSARADERQGPGGRSGDAETRTQYGRSGRESVADQNPDNQIVGASVEDDGRVRSDGLPLADSRAPGSARRFPPPASRASSAPNRTCCPRARSSAWRWRALAMPLAYVVFDEATLDARRGAGRTSFESWSTLPGIGHGRSPRHAGLRRSGSGADRRRSCCRSSTVSRPPCSATKLSCGVGLEAPASSAIAASFGLVASDVPAGVATPQALVRRCSLDGRRSRLWRRDPVGLAGARARRARTRARRTHGRAGTDRFRESWWAAAPADGGHLRL